MDAPCANYDDLRKRVLGNIGVKIDTGKAWAEGFRRALRFWNTVLEANFHEEENLDACSVRIIDGTTNIVNRLIVARSQLTGLPNFRGKIAVSPMAAQEMSIAEIYGAAVHEIGHMLGLEHNPNIRSVMYFLDLAGTEALDRKDILALGRHHGLRAAVLAKDLLPIQATPWKRLPTRRLISRYPPSVRPST